MGATQEYGFGTGSGAPENMYLEQAIMGAPPEHVHIWNRLSWECLKNMYSEQDIMSTTHMYLEQAIMGAPHTD